MSDRVVAAGDQRELKQARAVRTRERLLDAATTVAMQRGVANFTLENVADEAGVSKGGLLYHFKSKDELIVGLLDCTLAATEVEIQARADELGDVPGAFAIAYLDYVRQAHRPEVEFASSLLAAAAAESDLLASARASFQRWGDRLTLDDGISRRAGLLARVVSDGFWLIDLFGLAPPSEEERAEVLDVVVDLIRSEVEAQPGSS